MFTSLRLIAIPLRPCRARVAGPTTARLLRAGRDESGAQRGRRRGGFSMILVMLAIGFSLGLTYGFMQTQVTSLQLTQNEVRRDLALQAARTGISAGLLRMQDPAWIGLSDTYSKTTQQDGSNLVTVAVCFSSVASGEVPGVSDSELPLHVSIHSTGMWTSPRDNSKAVTRSIKAVVRLMPRLPGRTVRAGDVATATDLSTNSADYQATLPFTVTATSSSSTSMTFDPGTRFEGPIWLNRALSLFNSESWSKSVRSTMLTEIGNQYGSASPATFVCPHPLNGPVQFSSSPTASMKTDLGNLQTSWSTTAQIPSVVAINPSLWQSYRLYDGGPTYRAVVLTSSLRNVTLRPSVSNPLGIFLCSGNLDVYDNVTVQGTLVTAGTVTFLGTGSTVAAYNWISSTGAPVIADADQWPRLPAIVARNMTFSRSARVVIEGATVIDTMVSGGGGNFGYSTSDAVTLTGTATARRLQQPYSVISLQGSPDLTSIAGNQAYAIWLANGTTGRWYAINSVDNQSKMLTVIGEATFATPVSCKIAPNLSQFVRLYGPMVTGQIAIDSESMWGMGSTAWSDANSDWESTNNNRHGKPPITFSDWVGNPLNLIDEGWFVPSQTAIHGLQLEPTFSIQPTTGVNYLGKTPLFTPYCSTGSDSAASGYRWSIVDWREDL